MKRESVWVEILWVCFSVVLLGAWLLAQAAPVSVTAKPDRIVAGESTTLVTTVQLQTPTGSTRELTTSDLVSPVTTTTYTASVGANQSQVVVRVETAPPPPPAQWSTICATTGIGGGGTSTCPISLIDGRGFNWKLVFDEHNGRFLTYMGTGPDDGSIYSTDIHAVSARTKTVTRVFNGSFVQGGLDCLQMNPGVGHPLGLQWYDPVRKVYAMTMQLCGGYNVLATSEFDVVTNAMRPRQPHWPMEPWTGASIAWDSGIAYVSGYGKAIMCCGDNGYSVRMFEVDPATRAFVDISIQLKGADGGWCDVNQAYPNPTSPHCPNLRYGAAILSDGQKLWVFGGQLGSGPTVDLYRYDPATKIFTKMSPGGVLPSTTNAATPHAFVDTKRQRIVFVQSPTVVQFYSIAANGWSSMNVPNGPEGVFGGGACGYDPLQDAGLCVTSHGQSVAPDIRVLQFGQ